MTKIYQNLSGTTKDSFKIGKRGPVLIRGYGPPDTPDLDETIENGSLYIDQTNGDLWQLKHYEWLRIDNRDLVAYQYFMFLAQQETIQHVAELMYPRQEYKPATFSLGAVLAILFGLFVFLGAGIALIIVFGPA